MVCTVQADDWDEFRYVYMYWVIVWCVLYRRMIGMGVGMYISIYKIFSHLALCDEIYFFML